MLFSVLPFTGKAQNKFTIKGNLTGIKEKGMAYLALIKDGKYVNVDSTEVRKGKFKFVGYVAYPQNALIALRHFNKETNKYSHSQLGFFLENSAIKINGLDEISAANVVGSKTNDEKLQLNEKIAPLTRKIMKIQDEFEGKTKEEIYVNGKMIPYAAQAADSARRFIDSIKNLNISFVKNHPNSYYAMDVFITSVLGRKFDPAIAEPIFENFSDELKNSALGIDTRNKIQVAKRMTVGRTAIDFTQKDLNGNEFKLSSLRGKYVFVDFWASWCGPCRLENPHIIKAYEELKGEDFEVVGVSLDQNLGAWKDAVEKDNLPWIHVSDLKGQENDVAVLYGISAVPQNFLINPDGVIVAQNLRGEGLTEKLKAYIKPNKTN